MAWDVAWQSVETLSKNTEHLLVPIILQCPRDVCLARINSRYVEEPGWHGDPERFKGDHATALWDYLAKLDRPDVLAIDSNRPVDEVYADVKAHVTGLAHEGFQGIACAASAAPEPVFVPGVTLALEPP
jgi:thymidylate kinase